MKDAEAPEARVLTCESVPLGFDDQFNKPVKSIVLHMTDEAMPTDEVELSDDEKIGLKHLSDQWREYPLWRDDFIFDAGKARRVRLKTKAKSVARPL